MGRGSAQKVAILSRRQMEWVLAFMRLHENIETVIILEKPGSGPGPEMFARFYQKGQSKYHEIDITDAES